MYFHRDLEALEAILLKMILISQIRDLQNACSNHTYNLFYADKEFNLAGQCTVSICKLLFKHLRNKPGHFKGRIVYFYVYKLPIIMM